ncbi:signal peptidase I [Enterococcus sp. LJL120]
MQKNVLPKKVGRQKQHSKKRKSSGLKKKAPSSIRQKKSVTIKKRNLSLKTGTTRNKRRNQNERACKKLSHDSLRKKKKGGIKHKKNFRRKNFFKKMIREICDFCLIFLILMIVSIVISSFFFSINRVNGYSMLPSLRDDDLVIARKTDKIKRLDLLVFERRNKQEVRRVIGLPGDRIEYSDDVLYVNDKIIDEPYIIDLINEAQRNNGQYTKDFKMQVLTGEPFVPDNCYFVLGDNREWAEDSRDYGFIEETQIIGIVKVQLLPINDFSIY